MLLIFSLSHPQYQSSCYHFMTNTTYSHCPKDEFVAPSPHLLVSVVALLQELLKRGPYQQEQARMSTHGYRKHQGSRYLTPFFLLLAPLLSLLLYASPA